MYLNQCQHYCCNVHAGLIIISCNLKQQQTVLSQAKGGNLKVSGALIKKGADLETTEEHVATKSFDAMECCFDITLLHKTRHY